MPYWSALLSGVDAKRVEILCKADPGRYTMSLIGNIRGVLREAAGIIPQALQSQGLPVPECKIIVQLEPQEDIKDRASLELGVALAMLIEFLTHPADVEASADPSRQAGDAVAEHVADLGAEVAAEARRERERIARIEGIQDRNYFIIGELDIFGNVRSVRGLLSMLYHARDGDIVLVPAANEPEARLWALTSGAQDVQVFPVPTLRAAYETVLGQGHLPALSRRKSRGFTKLRSVGPDVDLRDIVGQERAKRALEIAAAGGHHCLLYGPTGNEPLSVQLLWRVGMPSVQPSGPLRRSRLPGASRGQAATSLHLRPGRRAQIPAPPLGPHPQPSPSQGAGVLPG